MVALDCQLDTGATCNVITHHDVCTIQQNGNPVLQPTSTKLKFYDGSLVTALGEYKAHCVYGGKPYNLDTWQSAASVIRKDMPSTRND